MNGKLVYSVEEAKRKLENYCAYQERCHQDVKQKLHDMRMIPEAIDAIIVHLLQENFLNESRFAKTFVSGKFRIKKWGKQRLTSELKKREISKVNIIDAIHQIDENDYLATLDELARKRLLHIRDTNIYKKRKKLADYLLYRGWESHLVFDKVKELIS